MYTYYYTLESQEIIGHRAIGQDTDGHHAFARLGVNRAYPVVRQWRSDEISGALEADTPFAMQTNEIGHIDKPEITEQAR